MKIVPELWIPVVFFLSVMAFQRGTSPSQTMAVLIDEIEMEMDMEGKGCKLSLKKKYNSGVQEGELWISSSVMAFQRVTST